MPTIEITGPDDQGQFQVEVESDDQEASEQQSGADQSQTGDDDQGQPGGNTQTCATVKDVLIAVKQALQGGQSQQDMWNQEAAKRQSAAAQLQ